MVELVARCFLLVGRLSLIMKFMPMGGVAVIGSFRVTVIAQASFMLLETEVTQVELLLEHLIRS